MILPLELIVQDQIGSTTIALELSAQSCWTSVLASYPLPREGALDQLDALFTQHPHPRTITIRACPSAALLPILWIRSIWFPVNTPEIIIEWSIVNTPITQAQQPAAKLACMLADRIRCADPNGAQQLWGFDPSTQIDPSEEIFDLLTSIVDLLDTDLTRVSLETNWNESLRQALLGCATLGMDSVALYGAGTHTRASANALMEPNVHIACIIDDDSRRHGQRLWGYEIVSRETALDLNLDAVIFSANSIEHILWTRTEPFRDQGVRTIPLYTGANGSDPERHHAR